MKKCKGMGPAILAAAILACAYPLATAQTTSDADIVKVSGGGSSARWEAATANAGGTLTISFPDGRSLRKTFKAGMSPQITIGDKQFENPPDGVYTYEVQLAPALSAMQKDAAAKARGNDDDPESVRASRKRKAVSGMIQSGSFAIVNGSIIVAGEFEPEQKREPKASTGSLAAPAARTNASDNLQQRIRNNHHAFFKPDFVIADDLVVQGSACVGLDCVNNEPFNFDTIRMKENNTRILFLDTSTSAGFATNDWIIKANDSTSGGNSYLGIVDHANAGTGAETGTIVAQFTAGAPANSINVASTGKVGFRTATPVLDLHMNTSDTPAIRWEQNGSGGFTAQTWDIGANEANFFVRDVTSGSRLSFRIRPGAPTSSLDISASGNVGVANASPSAQLHVIGADQNEFAGNFEQTNIQASNGLSIKTQTTAAGDAALHVASNAGATVVLSARNNGRVGIGTTAPDQLLSVNGDASKAAGGGSWQVFSDVRLKTIHGKFNRGLSAVMRLQPLQYQYKPGNSLGLKSDTQQIGFSAQDLEKLIPEAVNRNENGYLTVNNDPILWTMLNAIKEQQKQIEELKAEVRKLRGTSRRHRR